jgi:hypothetical protein
MPFFQVLVEGTGLSIPGDPETPPIVGFFASRVVWATSKLKAEEIALRSVRQLWATGSYASQPSAGSLVLAVSESSPSTFLKWLRAPNKGHAFFPAEGQSEA